MERTGFVVAVVVLVERLLFTTTTRTTKSALTAEVDEARLRTVPLSHWFLRGVCGDCVSSCFVLAAVLV